MGGNVGRKVRRRVSGKPHPTLKTDEASILARWIDHPSILANMQVMEDRLQKIETDCCDFLQQAGYQTDPDGLAQDHWWRRLNRSLKKGNKPSSTGERARRAAAALLLVRQLREALVAGDAFRAARYALDLGPLREGILTDALTVKVNRSKANVNRQDAKQVRVNEANRIAGEINDERAGAGLERLSHSALTRSIKRKTTNSRLKKLSLRTIQDYLA